MVDKYKKDAQELEELLDITSTRVQQNVKIVTPEDYDDYPYMLHISTDTKIRKFIPSMTLRGSPTENRDITRVYVAPTLLGCMIGYAGIFDDVMGKASDGKEDNSGYKGGWMIYALPYSAALKPNTKLVYDFKYSDEHWLVTYNETTREFVPKPAGKFFVQAITLVPRNKKLPKPFMTFYVEITLDEGMPFGKKRQLEKGCWKIEGVDPDFVESWRDDELEYTFTSIPKAEFESAKRASADLLSHTDALPARPASLNWAS